MAFVIITPTFKKMGISPILGFLGAGLALRLTKCAAVIVYSMYAMCLSLPCAQIMCAWGPALLHIVVSGMHMLSHSACNLGRLQS